MAAPAISVVIPVHDGEAYLREAAASALGQTLRDLELVLVDDGSRDGSAALLREIAATDPRVRTLFGRNRGAGAATNAGIAAARGEWIARLDQDDVLPPERFEAQLGWMERERVDVCGTQVEVFGAESRTLWFPESPRAVHNELVFRPSIMQPATMRRRTALENPYAAGVAFDDYELLTRLAPRHVLANMPIVGLRHRRHARQTQSVARTRLLEDLRKYRFRYFYERFPGTPLERYVPLARVAEGRPLASLPELECAGSWLVDLSAGCEPRLRERMARRWRETWARSRALLPVPATAAYTDVLAELEGGDRASDARAV